MALWTVREGISEEKMGKPSSHQRGTTWGEAFWSPDIPEAAGPTLTGQAMLSERQPP